MKILITGSSGQLGQALLRSKPEFADIVTLPRSDLDLTDIKKCKEVINFFKPTYLINCAAYTNVDQAESNKEIAMTINSTAVKAMAEEVYKFGGNFLQISTDYVFNGIDRKTPYKPYEQRNPIGIYGLSKAKGEEAIEEVFKDTQRGIILRTSWLMGPVGKNFALTMLKLHSSKKEFSVVSDQIGTATMTFDLANVCWEIINPEKKKNFFLKNPVPIFHFSNSGITNWHEIAISVGEIAQDIGILKNISKVIAIPSSQYPTLARRPNYSVLESTDTINKIGVKSPFWKDSLKKLLQQYKIHTKIV